MNTNSQPKSTSQEFDIHVKLKSANSHWCYCYAVQPCEKGFNYQFNTTFVGEIEFAVYERKENYFVLVDFFKSYDEACDDAKKIIDNHPDIKKNVYCQLTNKLINSINHN
ncbi:hypothetical protein [Enterobacter kobei]|uniref:hypothetical protein n=1 Tax=Enterobacter kobei TaxID=208224 RepID=UPI0026F258EF|nr:hypothetical protein [Enterobacter kobei]